MGPRNPEKTAAGMLVHVGEFVGFGRKLGVAEFAQPAVLGQLSPRKLSFAPLVQVAVRRFLGDVDPASE